MSARGFGPTLTVMDTTISSTALTALAIADLVRTRKISAIDVTRQHLERIAALDPTFGAFELVRGERALAEAAALDALPNRESLPLAGVPVAIKDNTDVAGEPTRHGSAATSAAPAAADAELVRRLRAAGCIVIGKTRMPELAAWAYTSSAASGPTRNPWDPSRDPGGSSGGSAVAVATGMAALALGTDGGGSIRVPAAVCGVVGIKPAPSDVPLREHWFGLTSAGPLARTVSDASAMLDVLRGTPIPTEPARPLRIAVSWKAPSPLSRVDSHQRKSVEYADRLLRDAGHAVRRAEPPYPALLIPRWTRRWHAGIAQDAASLRFDDLEPRTRTMVRKGRRVLALGGPRPAVAAAWHHAALAWFAECDVLVSPVIAAPPPLAGWINGKGYLTTLRTAAAGTSHTQAWNLAGFPAMTVPIGVANGQPQAVQLVAKPGEDALMLQVAVQLERFTPPPSLPR
jgi:amidase